MNEFSLTDIVFALFEVEVVCDEPDHVCTAVHLSTPAATLSFPGPIESMN